jgi:hypothetical protein
MTHYLTAGIVSWSSYYGNHQLVSVSVRFVHLMAIALGGGSALLTDIWVIRARKATLTEKDSAFNNLCKIHGLVISWIAVLVVTGLLMTLADLGTFWHSKVYWIKMALVAALVINGFALLLAERRVQKIGIAQGWGQLANISIISFVLWSTTLFAGTFLTVSG